MSDAQLNRSLASFDGNSHRSFWRVSTEFYYNVLLHLVVFVGWSLGLFLFFSPSSSLLSRLQVQNGGGFSFKSLIHKRTVMLAGCTLPRHFPAAFHYLFPITTLPTVI